MRERLRFEKEIRDLDVKVGQAKNARATGGWKSPTDPFDQGQAKLIDRMFAESPLLSLFLKGAVEKKVTVAANLQVSDHKEYVKHFAQHLQDLGKWQSDSDTEEQSNNSGGFTDKKRGKIYLHDYHNRGWVKVENAVHEGIHLIAHPAGAAKAPFNTFRAHYRGKFDEGVTQYFTERVLFEQGFKSPKTGTYAFELEPVERINGWLGKAADELMADAYFNGKLQRLRGAMIALWGEQVVNRWWRLLQEDKYKDADKLLRESPQKP